MPDAVVEAEDGPREQSGVVLRQQPLLHPAGEERPPGELEVPDSRSRGGAGGFLARKRPVSAEGGDLRDEHAVPQHLPVGQVEGVDEDGEERIRPVVVRSDDPLEAVVERVERLTHDLVEAVLLRLEVVVERGRADADGGGDVRPLRLLVAVPPEVVGRDVEDLIPLRPRTRLRLAAAARRPRRRGCPWCP